MSKTIVVTTTIRVPDFLIDLCKNAKKYRHADISFIIIGDVKTPSRQVKELSDYLIKEFGFDVDYLDIADQKKVLSDYQELLSLMSLNSGSRKMIGNFIAYLKNPDRLIMIDDDNFVGESDFFGLYNVVGAKEQMKLIHSDNGWYNVYESLVEAHSIPFYPRGYPWSKRNTEKPIIERCVRQLPIIVKNGLVLEDPDIDAISRLFWPIRVTAMKPEFEPHFGLCPGTWTSFNNQNTAVNRDILSVYFTPPSTGRNADIWTSYVICKLAEHLNGVVSFGHPLVRQLRNPHNLWKDLDDEVVNDRATDRFVAFLKSTELSEDNYLEALGELSRKCLDNIYAAETIPEDEKQMMQQFFIDYQVWQRLCLKVREKTPDMFFAIEGK